MKPIRVEWACPRCGAKADEHGKGGLEKCKSHCRQDGCAGFLCECEEDTDEDHGDTYANPCITAYCYHCHWSGTFPVKPKGLAPWEKKALEAGWTPPKARAKELQISGKRS